MRRTILVIVMIFATVYSSSEYTSDALFKLLLKQKIHQHEDTVTGTESTDNEKLVKELIESSGMEDDSDHDISQEQEACESKARIKRQVSQDDIKEALCKDKGKGEFFRLVAGEAHCRDVVACSEHGLQAIRCPSGLAFDLRKQTCDWRAQVKDCNQKARPKLSLPQYVTEEPVCIQKDDIACGDGTCLQRSLFCDDHVDCPDGSDENLCDARNDPNGASECDPRLCKLPECFCSVTGQEIPGDLPPEQVPQMIVITFDDAVNHNNYEEIERFLNSNLKNPNSCDIKTTFFVSHQYNNYSMVQELHRRGHEIAAHSISHENDEDYWQAGTQETWAQEMGGMKEILSKWANIPVKEVYGSRAPFLKMGGNRQMAALEKANFLYDSTMVAPLTNPPYWPYPLAFASPHRCYGNDQKCPTRSHSLMEMVMNELDPREEPGSVEDLVTGCAMLDSCAEIRTPDTLYNVLTHNFIRHYEQNRAPLGLYLHAAWFVRSPDMLEALLFWLEELLNTYDDVYVVSMSQVLAWMQRPTIAARAVNFAPWKTKCTSLDTPDKCQESNDCELSSPSLLSVQRLQTCNQCPRFYPWLGDSKGTNPETRS